jgi:hypothetical protein
MLRRVADKLFIRQRKGPKRLKGRSRAPRGKMRTRNIPVIFLNAALPDLKTSLLAIAQAAAKTPAIRFKVKSPYNHVTKA